jgi:hypothetical protein
MGVEKREGATGAEQLFGLGLGCLKVVPVGIKQIVCSGFGPQLLQPTGYQEAVAI